jgi:4-amino-4-deoxy-L-arabinose transferase-like glycosyltransferase
MTAFSLRSKLIAAALGLGAAMVYLPQLQHAPFYLGRDEMFFGLTAHSVASTGHDTFGRFMPLYFQTQMRYGSEMWFQPILMYSTILSVKVLGLTEGTIRLPMAIAGIVDVVLVYFIARLMFERELPAIVAAVLMAFAPAHYIHSRVAMDFQTPLPFMLGWLMCLLLYLRRGQLALLFVAGLLLGIGIYTYIAAYMLMPIYALLTAVVLYLRREPLTHYAVLAAGFVLPVLCSVPFLWTHPTVLRDVFWHYERDKPQTAGALHLFSAFFTYERFARAAAVYLGFWSPRFLFINGPQSMWVAGAFLLPTAGLLVVGLVRVVRLSAPVAVLLVGGLLTAPIPASLVGDGEAIHRASEVLPFGVLLAAVGFDYLWSAANSLTRSMAFVVTWAVVIALAWMYHYELPLAQAIIRAATVPLAVAGLYVLVRAGGPFDALGWPRLALIAIVLLSALQLSYWAVGYSLVAWTSLAVLAAAVAAMQRSALPSDCSAWRVLVVVALTVAASHFMHAYGDYSYGRRIGFVPATVIQLALGLTYAACALATLAGVAAVLKRAGVERREPGRAAVFTGVAILVLQVTYFYINYFSDPRLRAIHALVVLAVAGSAVAALTGAAGASRFRLGQVAAVALFGLATLQFAYFYADYFTRYRDHAGNLDTEGNARIAWETIIERAQHRSVPAIHLCEVGPYGFADLYWTFYTIKARICWRARRVTTCSSRLASARCQPTASSSPARRRTPMPRLIGWWRPATCGTRRWSPHRMGYRSSGFWRKAQRRRPGFDDRDSARSCHQAVSRRPFAHDRRSGGFAGRSPARRHHRGSQRGARNGGLDDLRAS